MDLGGPGWTCVDLNGPGCNQPYKLLIKHTIYFQSSTIPTYQKLNAFMESAKPSVYTATNGAGIERVRKEDGMYAFFMEGASIEYNVERKCDLTQIGGLLDSKGYGVALPPGIYLRD